MLCRIRSVGASICIGVLGVAGVADAQPTTQALVVGRCLCNWDNGDFDAFDGQLSTQTAGGVVIGTVADDFFLQPGKLHRLDGVRALLLTNDPSPEGVLELFRDCNGAPGDSIGTFPMLAAYGTGVQLAGFDLVEFEFDTHDCRLEGGQLYWASPRGIRTTHELYYLATAGGGVVQGAQAHFTLPDAGINAWTPIDETNVGKSDFAFAVCSTPCDILFDNGRPDYLASYPAALNLARPSYRIADDFALPGCDDWRIDAIRLCALSNCDIATFRVEISETDPVTCLPRPLPTYVFTNPKVIPLGVAVPTDEATPRVMDAFELQFGDLGVTLEGGHTYWISAAVGGAISLGDRGYLCESFDCNKDAQCQIKIQPATFYKPTIGAWQTVGAFLGANAPERSLAFQICGQRLLTERPNDPNATGGAEPCDWNNDGFVNAQDWFDWSNDFFSGVGPRASSDFNDDGFENAQDWFDFVNCYSQQTGDDLQR